MAASMTEVNIGSMQTKRKNNELEDITNNDGYHNKKMKVNFKTMYFKDERKAAPQQQRSPSPSDLSLSSPSKPRSKSVSFELAQNQQYEGSPLLTPKDEDDEDDYQAPPAPAGDGLAPDMGGPQYRDPTRSLNNNSDYLALTSSLRLLSNSEDKIQREIVELSNILNFHATNSDKGAVVDFFLKLLDNELDLPKQNRILKCPLIDWSKYHNGLTNVSKESFEDSGNSEKLLFKTLNLFGSK